MALIVNLVGYVIAFIAIVVQAVARWWGNRK